MRPDVKAKEVLQYAMPVKSIAGPDYIVGRDTSVRDACANGGGSVPNYGTVNGFIAISSYLPEAYYALDVHLTRHGHLPRKQLWGLSFRSDVADEARVAAGTPETT